MRADRLLAMMLLLQTRGKMTAHKLAAELGVSRRTILRDLDALSIAGVPVYAEGGHGGGIALDEDYRSTLAGLQDKEVRALFVASNNELLNEVGLGEAAKSTLLKLLAVLPDSQRPKAEHIRQRLLIDPTWWWREAQPPFWEVLQQAVYEDWRIQITYERHDGQVTERELEPYSLIAKSSLWYLVAKQGDEFRTFRVSRIQSLTRLNAHFQRQPNFDLPTYWQAHLSEFVETISEYNFTLKVHPDRVNFVRWLAPGRSTFEPTNNANEWLVTHIHLESLDLAKMLVFGLGKQGEVLGPPELKEQVLVSARELVENVI